MLCGVTLRSAADSPVYQLKNLSKNCSFFGIDQPAPSKNIDTSSIKENYIVLFIPVPRLLQLY